MTKPKKIKNEMPAPERRSLTLVEHMLKSPKAGSHKDQKKAQNKRESRKKYNSGKDGW